MKTKAKLDKTQVSLAGEFAVLSQLALYGYNANMTLGHTKGVDILVSDPRSGKMLRLEVKTNFLSTRSQGGDSKLFGKYLSSWILSKKNEVPDPNLFYCFVNISGDSKQFRYFIVPSAVVATYVAKQHRYWLDAHTKGSVKDTDMRNFRIGFDGEKYSIRTPIVERYEDNWDFKK